MNILFYLSSVVAIAATVLAITRRVAVHALLYVVVSLLAVALVFFSLGAHFVAALEVIVYAGAIIVLFVFVVMMLNQPPESTSQQWWSLDAWIGPVILAAILLAELIYVLTTGNLRQTQAVMVSPKDVGLSMYGPYLIGVELASTLLLAGLVGAYHIGRRERPGGGELPWEP